MPTVKRPTPAEIAAACGKSIPDVIAPDLKLLFVGINPSLYSAAVGHHFGRPGNRFWPALHGGGFTERLLDPSEDRSLLERGYGITNVVAAATARADELTEEEILTGGKELLRKVKRYRPALLAFLGVSTYRTAFGQPKAKIGFQPDFRIADARVWVLPSPSGLNAHYHLTELSRLFAELREAVNADVVPSRS
jgi:TDG/mug DNA glycosylase family protein